VKIVWTDQAYRRLAEIEDFVARDRPEAAERRVPRLIDRADVLAHQPSLGRTLPELPRSGLRELVEGNYRIVYRLREDAVDVLTVVEGHRRLPVGDLP
jgi:toxin ParE1/3/4